MNTLIKLLELYPDKPWNWYKLSFNPNITWEIVQTNPDKPWNWYYLSQNKFLKNPIALKNYKYNKRKIRTINRILSNDDRLYSQINIVINKYL
jgi:hypothetical protein